MRRRAPSSDHGGGRDFKRRRVFTKLLKDKNATLSSVHQGQRFIEGMETFDSKAELLAKLQDTRETGMQRIRDVLSLTNSVADVEALLIPLLCQIMNEETSRPLYRPLRDKILMAVYALPGFMQALVKYDVARALEKSSATMLCSFLRALTKAFIEPRRSEQVSTMARDLRERGDVGEASVLCTFLLVDDRESGALAIQKPSPVSNPTTAACWVSDIIPPGGRHDNDHRNYRNVQILPTVEELACATKPYLPLASGENRFIAEPVASLLDSNFRLLREDAVSAMRENIAQSMSGTWKNARIVDLHLEKRGSVSAVSFIIRCDSQGKMNWKRSRALMHGSVVALCRQNIPVRMGTINVREDAWLSSPSGPKIGVVFESNEEFNASIEEMVHNTSIDRLIWNLREELASVKRDADHRQSLNRRLGVRMCQLISYDLVEVSKSFFAYQPILKTLQGMESIPLLEQLVGSSSGAVAKPDYLPKKVTLPKGKDYGAYECTLSEWSSSDITKATSLDMSQAEALRHALTARVALVQGPPGCGKTFIGALFSRIIRENTDESILCVCYTNHALDQFLEHMLEAGETRLVRIGGRSKSERLAGYQLKALSRQKTNRDSFCLRRVRQVDAQLFKLRASIEEAVEVFKLPIEWNSPSGGVRAFLKSDEPETLAFLRVPQLADGFKLVGPSGKAAPDDYLWDCWRRGDSLPVWMLQYIDGDTADGFRAFWASSFDNRVATIELWRKDILQPEATHLNGLVADVTSLVQEKQSLQQDNDLQILHQARIIGATTSGAATYRDLLAAKAAGIVLVEEAGEVLESHILSSLSDSTKQLILIGDHKQLRPKVENYELSTVSGRGYNLDCSLFERLILTGHTSVALQVQHRMRPSISALIRAQTYPNLQDHESVHRYPKVKGVSENIIYVDHAHFEDGADDTDNTMTKSNRFEAELSIEFVRYFLLQGYRTDQIVVLTPYLGQLLTLIHLMKSRLKEVTALVSDSDIHELEDFDPTKSPLDNLGPGMTEGIRCSTIDNFQGEEADIIVISLVRSNRRGIIGFLKEEQRVNVLLSRARHGMFLLGNSATLKKSGRGRDVWEPILNMFASGGKLRKGLPTTCQLHPADEPIDLCIPADFRHIRPNGGCHRPCAFRLSCGHACPMMCHPIDQSHERAQRLCCEPCKRFPPDCKLHPCPKLCKEKCGACCAPLGPVLLKCGHTTNNAICHQVNSPAALEIYSLLCQKTVDHTFELCGHKEKTSCANTKRAVPECPAACGKPVKCGHPCKKKCGLCDGNHQCEERCQRLLFCGHECDRLCHLSKECRPCEKKCSARCSHSQCPQKCSTPCSSCVEKCDWYCEHQGSCPLVCGAPCSRLPCNERCGKMLSCGHQCPSLCGEDCPDSMFCHECGTAGRSQVVNMICLSTYQDHDVDDDPVIFLPCGHFFAVSTLDGCLEIDSVYDTDETGNTFTGLKPLRGNQVSEKPKQCPDCRAAIQSVRRYGRFLRLVELRSLERKHMMVVKRALDDLSRLVEKSDTNVIGGLKKLEKTIRKSPMNVIFEACGGVEVVETSPPPSAPLIKCLELQGMAFESRVRTFNDEDFVRAKRAYEEAILVAEQSSSIRSGAVMRVILAKFLVKSCDNVDRIRDDVDELLDWVVNHRVQFDDLIADAAAVKEQLKNASLEMIKSIVQAMDHIRGRNLYGGSASSHWFECRNGHPFFIGECGGAMQTSACIECGEPVGGSGHRLLASNSQGAGIISHAMQE